MSRFKWITTAVIILIAAIFCISLVFYWMSDSHETGLKTRESPSPAKEYKVSVRSIPLYYDIMGLVKPKYETVISSEVNGVIDKVLVREGDTVENDSVLLIIGKETITKQLNQAMNSEKKLNTSLELLKKQYERTVRLHEKGAAPLVELETTQTKYEETQHEKSRIDEKVSELKVLLDKYTVTSPYSGVISKKYIETGEFVTPGKPLFDIYSKSPLLFEMNVPESVLPFVHIGDHIAVQFNKGALEVAAEISEITPYENPKSHTFTVKGSIPDSNELLPGTFGRAVVPYGEKLSILVPKQAVIQVGQLHTVLVKENGNWVRRYVRVGKDFGGSIEVVSGLEEGDIIGYGE